MSDAATTLCEDAPLGSGDVLTFSFADAQAGVYGQARVVALADGGRHALVAVFEGTRALIATQLAPGALTLESEGPTRWTARAAAAAPREGAFDVELVACGPPAALVDGPGTVEDGVQQPATVTGHVRAGGREVAISGRGQIGVARGAAPWGDLALRREIDCWLPDGRAIALRAGRPSGAANHGEELVEAVLIDSEPALTAPLDEARVSTIYDGEGLPRRAGLELWPTAESDYPRRAAGEALCAVSVRGSADGNGTDVRWDCAFLRWHMEGEEGVGPYSIVRLQAR